MNVMFSNQTKEIKLDESCSAIEYEMDDKDINAAIIKLSGRSPITGKVVNNKCKELAYVISGSGKIVIEDKEIILNQGDMIIIEPGEKYYWDGQMILFVPCTPAWTASQSQLIE